MEQQLGVHRNEQRLDSGPITEGDWEVTFYLYRGRWVRAYKKPLGELGMPDERFFYREMSEAMRKVFRKFAHVDGEHQLKWAPDDPFIIAQAA